MEEGSKYDLSYLYDIVAAFARFRINKERRLHPNTVSQMLKVKKSNFDESRLVAIIDRLARRIVTLHSSAIEAVTIERQEEIIAITELSTSSTDVRTNYNQLMKEWLCRDVRRASWERVIMALAFTMRLVIRVLLKYPESCAERIRDLVAVTTDFIDNYMYTWITLNNGWRGLINCSNEMLRKNAFDIPDSSIAVIDGDSCASKPAITIQDDTSVEHQENIEHDLLVAYVKQNMAWRNKKCHQLSRSKIELCVRLTAKTQSMEGSGILKSLQEIAKRVVPLVASSFMSVLRQWSGEICRMIDYTLPKHVVWEIVDKFLFAWLIQDSHPMNWDRVVMIFEFTCEVVYRVSVTWNKIEEMERVTELIDIVQNFISTYIKLWVSRIGGWSKVIEQKSIFLQRKTHDIPSSAIYNLSKWIWDPSVPSPDRHIWRLKEAHCYGKRVEQEKCFQAFIRQENFIYKPKESDGYILTGEEISDVVRSVEDMIQQQRKRRAISENEDSQQLVEQINYGCHPGVYEDLLDMNTAF